MNVANITLLYLKNNKMAFIVDDKFRINELSFTPGGKNVEIFFKNKSSRIYTKVKYPYKIWVKAREEDPNVVNYRII